LLKHEVNLARVELSEKATRLGGGAATLVKGGFVLHLGVFFLLLALAEGISLFVVAQGWESAAEWIGPLIVGIVVMLIGWGMASSARATFREETVVPTQSKESLEEDRQWLNEKLP